MLLLVLLLHLSHRVQGGQRRPQEAECMLGGRIVADAVVVVIVVMLAELMLVLMHLLVLVLHLLLLIVQVLLHVMRRRRQILRTARANAVIITATSTATTAAVARVSSRRTVIATTAVAGRVPLTFGIGRRRTGAVPNVQLRRLGIGPAARLRVGGRCATTAATATSIFQ